MFRPFLLFLVRAADTYDLSDLVLSSPSDAVGFDPGVAALNSVSMLNRGRFPVAELLEHTTLDEVCTCIQSWFAIFSVLYLELCFCRRSRRGSYRFTSYSKFREELRSGSRTGG